MGESQHLLETEVKVGARGIDVRVAGEIDIANVDEFRALLWALPPTPAPLRVDLGGVDLLSAAGVRALVAMHLRTRARGGQLILCNPNPVVRRTLRATRVNRIIPIIGSSAADDVIRPWPRGSQSPKLGAKRRARSLTAAGAKASAASQPAGPRPVPIRRPAPASPSI
jgi:anti-sigma B factor antagonist